MRDFDLIPFDEGTDVLAAPSMGAALEPRKTNPKTKRRSSRKVTVPEPQAALRTENLEAFKTEAEPKPKAQQRGGFSLPLSWMVLGVLAAYFIAQHI